MDLKSPDDNVVHAVFGAKKETQSEQHFLGALEDFIWDERFSAEYTRLHAIADALTKQMIRNAFGKVDIGPLYQYDCLLVREAVLSMLLANAKIKHPLHDYAQQIVPLIFDPSKDVE